MDWDAIRAEFPALERWTYLNTATFGQIPRRAVAAVEAHFAHRDELACADFLDWYTDADRLRVSIAKLINAESDDIAFIPSAAAGLSMVLAGLNLSPDDNVVTLDDEFPNYQYLGSARKVPWERFYESVDTHTRLAAFSEVNYSTGFRPPLREVSAYLAERQIPLFIDGTQSVGALRFDVQRTPVDVLAVHGYKWLISPTGAGFMYISPAFREKLPPNVIGWRSHRDWRKVDQLHYGTPVFKASAEKYEGANLQFPLLYAMEASVNWLLEIGPEAIERRVLDLANRIRAVLNRAGALVTLSDSQIVTAEFPGRDVSQIASGLRGQGVLAAVRHGRLRISPHFYNNEDDIARFESVLKVL